MRPGKQTQSLNPIRLAIFASGGGSNARQLLEYFRTSTCGEIVLLATNRAQSGTWSLGKAYRLPVLDLCEGRYREAGQILAALNKHSVDLLVLAGYLKLIPSQVVAVYPSRILNIHPALLPAYGGRGMYGMNVHRSVIAANEAQSGMTIHYVNEVYDQGEILFQKSVSIGPDWTPEQLQQAVLRLEHQYFAPVVEQECQKLLELKHPDSSQEN